MKRRAATVAFGSVVVSAAGCLTADAPADSATTDSPADGTPTDTSADSMSTDSPITDSPTDEPTDRTIRVHNDVTQRVTADVRVSQTDDETVVLDEQFQLASGATRSVTVTDGTPPFRIAASMPDGPVESVFTHQWDATAPLTVTLHDSGIDYE